MPARTRTHANVVPCMRANCTVHHCITQQLHYASVCLARRRAGAWCITVAPISCTMHRTMHRYASLGAGQGLTCRAGAWCITVAPSSCTMRRVCLARSRAGVDVQGRGMVHHCSTQQLQYASGMPRSEQGRGLRAGQHGVPISSHSLISFNPVLTPFPMFYAICMRNHRVIIGNVAECGLPVDRL